MEAFGSKLYFSDKQNKRRRFLILSIIIIILLCEIKNENSIFMKHIVIPVYLDITMSRLEYVVYRNMNQDGKIKELAEDIAYFFIDDEKQEIIVRVVDLTLEKQEIFYKDFMSERRIVLEGI